MEFAGATVNRKEIFETWKLRLHKKLYNAEFQLSLMFVGKHFSLFVLCINRTYLKTFINSEKLIKHLLTDALILQVLHSRIG